MKSVLQIVGCNNCDLNLRIKNEFLIDAEGGPFNPTSDSNQVFVML